MFKPKAFHEIKIGDRIYQFLVDHDAPLKEVVDVAAIFFRNVKKICDDAEAAQQPPVEAVEPCKVESING